MEVVHGTPSLQTYLTHSENVSYNNIHAHTKGESLLALKMMEIKRTFNLVDEVFSEVEDVLANIKAETLVVRVGDSQDPVSVGLLFGLCAAYKSVHLYNSVLNVTTPERFAIACGYKQMVAPPFYPHMYFLMKLDEMNVIYGQQQLDLMNAADLCAEWCQRYY